MNRVRIKICGITTADDAHQAAAAGADAIGLVFHEASPRAVSLAQAAAIAAAVPPFVSVIGLFVNADAGRVRAVLDSVALDGLQFHGDETAEFCAGFGRPWIKALRVSAASSLDREQIAAYAMARGLLLDTLDTGVAGGSGRSFDWSLVPTALPRPLILAGGLHAGNVGQAIRQLRPWAVDVSSGVESAPGRKDPLRIRSFVAAVLSA